MNVGTLTIRIQTDLHGGLEDGCIGVVRRTVALWLISCAQWLLKTRIDLSMRNESH